MRKSTRLKLSMRHRSRSWPRSWARVIWRRLGYCFLLAAANHRCAARRTLAEYAGRILPPDRSCEVSAGIGIRNPRRRPECCGSPYGPSTSNWVSADRASHPTPQQSSCEHLGLVAQDAQLVIGVKAKALRLLSVSAPRLELLDRRATPSR